MAVDRESIDALLDLQNKVSRKAQDKARALFARLDLSRPETARDALLELMPILVDKYGDAAGVAGAQWYDELRSKVDGLPPYKVTIADKVEAQHVRATVRRVAGVLWGANAVADLEAQLLPAVDRWVKNQSRASVAVNIKRDPAKPSWARVPTGSYTCAWCGMLASRGFVYRSDAMAAAGGHTGCDCQIVPSFTSDTPIIAGYEPDRWYEHYLQARAEVIANGGDPRSVSQITKQMRRMFPNDYTDGTGRRKKNEVKVTRKLFTEGVQLGWADRHGNPLKPLADRRSYEQLLAHAAPMEDPDRFYVTASERRIASFLRSIGYKPRSVKPFKKSGGSPDCIVDSLHSSMEFKTTLRANYLSALDQIGRGVHQSSSIVYSAEEWLSEELARSIMRSALNAYGENIDQLIVMTEDGGKYLEWLRQ